MKPAPPVTSALGLLAAGDRNERGVDPLDLEAIRRQLPLLQARAKAIATLAPSGPGEGDGPVPAAVTA